MVRESCCKCGYTITAFTRNGLDKKNKKEKFEIDHMSKLPICSRCARAEKKSAIQVMVNVLREKSNSDYKIQEQQNKERQAFLAVERKRKKEQEKKKAQESFLKSTLKDNAKNNSRQAFYNSALDWYEIDEIEPATFAIEGGRKEFDKYKLVENVYYKEEERYIPLEASFGAKMITLQHLGSKYMAITGIGASDEGEMIDVKRYRNFKIEDVYKIDTMGDGVGPLEVFFYVESEELTDAIVPEVGNKVIIEYQKDIVEYSIELYSSKKVADRILNYYQTIEEIRKSGFSKDEKQFFTAANKKIKEFSFTDDQLVLIENFYLMLDKIIFANCSNLRNFESNVYWQNYVRTQLWNKSYNPDDIAPKQILWGELKDENLKNYYALWELLRKEIDDGFDGCVLELMLLKKLRCIAGKHYLEKDFSDCMPEKLVKSKKDEYIAAFILNCLRDDKCSPKNEQSIVRLTLVFEYLGLDCPSRLFYIGDFYRQIESEIVKLSQQVQQERLHKKLTSGKVYVKPTYTIDDVDLMSGFEFDSLKFVSRIILNSDHEPKYIIRIIH